MSLFDCCQFLPKYRNISDSLDVKMMKMSEDGLVKCCFRVLSGSRVSL